LHDNILELKVHFESKLILIQQLDEKDWIKLMYIKYIIYSFSTATKPHVCGSSNITKQKKIEKIIQWPFIKAPPLWYGSGIFILKIYYYAFIIQKYKKHIFFNEISSNNFKSLNDPRFNSCISISYTIKKIHPRSPFTTLVLK